MAKSPAKPVAPVAPPAPVVLAAEPATPFFSPRNVPLWASLVLAAVVAAGIWAKQQAGG